MYPARQMGFSLIETAIVLLIVSLALGGLVVTLGQSAENSRRAEAQLQIRRIEEALIGYAQSTGRLPCPSSTTSRGAEDPIGGGNCAQWHGLIPAQTLGLSGPTNADGFLLDPWGNPYRYSVASLNTPASGRAFTSNTGLSWTFSNNNPLAASADLLRICPDSVCATPLADGIPAMVLSMGSNWATFTSAQEVTNAGGVTIGAYRFSANNTFVSMPFSDQQFDDIIVWVSPNILYSRLINSGLLP
jgi:type II secretory pathway pseudopilin PulG